MECMTIPFLIVHSYGSAGTHAWFRFRFAPVISGDARRRVPGVGTRSPGIQRGRTATTMSSRPQLSSLIFCSPLPAK
jgi:hypothetical protein